MLKEVKKIMKNMKANFLSSLAVEFSALIPSAIRANRELDTINSRYNALYLAQRFPKSVPAIFSQLQALDEKEDDKIGGIKGMRIIELVAIREPKHAPAAIATLGRYGWIEAVDAMLEIGLVHRESFSAVVQTAIDMMDSSDNLFKDEILKRLSRALDRDLSAEEKCNTPSYDDEQKFILAEHFKNMDVSAYPPELAKFIAETRQSLLRSIFRNSTGLSEFHNPEDMKRVEMLKAVFAEYAPQLHRLGTGMLDYQETIRKTAPALQAA